MPRATAADSGPTRRLWVRARINTIEKADWDYQPCPLADTFAEGQKLVAAGMQRHGIPRQAWIDLIVI
jgi:hypothetical protein